ncbi:AlpA family transcriptional regulator [Vibrio metschnikovii]|uniref:helix-turn-helix transcriptional regulator n=1 Tax=Vibrio metschnikovii TaxID=28172 RepID=UPI002FC786F6|nr:AlpA family transcriptional regulator [Vibrio metschnikovii]EKO3626930.1 AlpA family transcriptional regulator [Vibrio metschnikovii]EKO3768447.1 AlpA family transcriptional regulator [Vibrio metschnikovii]
MTQIETSQSLNIDPVLRFPEVLALTGARSRQTIYNWIKKGDFPAPLQLGGNSIGWPKSECDAWRKERAEKRKVAA